MVRCICAACAQGFSSETAFNAHRIGDFSKGTRRCLMAPEMLAKGLRFDGEMWTLGEMSEEDKKRVRGQSEK